MEKGNTRTARRHRGAREREARDAPVHQERRVRGGSYICFIRDRRNARYEMSQADPPSRRACRKAWVSRENLRAEPRTLTACAAGGREREADGRDGCARFQRLGCDPALEMPTFPPHLLSHLNSSLGCQLFRSDRLSHAWVTILRRVHTYYYPNRAVLDRVLITWVAQLLLRVSYLGGATCTCQLELARIDFPMLPQRVLRLAS